MTNIIALNANTANEQWKGYLMIATKGKKVSVHYTGTLENGEIFDSSLERTPLEFTIGAGQMIKGFDQGVEGMKVGDKRTLTLNPEDAYGNRNGDLVFSISKSQMPKGYTPETGDKLQMNTAGGGLVTVTVSAINKDDIELDANHELAGKTLTFEVEMIKIS